MNFAKFLRTTIYIEQLRWLLLDYFFIKISMVESTLTHFQPLFHFYTPWNHVFRGFRRGILIKNGLSMIIWHTPWNRWYYFDCNDSPSNQMWISKLKGTLMQIWKSSYMFVFLEKQYPENFAFLILRIFRLCGREVCKFLKK